MERTLIGIVSSHNEIVPGHMNLDKIVDAVKIGVAMAGGTPVMIPAIAVCDGIAMGHVGMKYSLVTRDLIADSTECMAMAHAFDGDAFIISSIDPHMSEHVAQHWKVSEWSSGFTGLAGMVVIKIGRAQD